MTRELESPDVWNEPERAQALGRERAGLEKIVGGLRRIADGLVEATELLELAEAENDEDTALAVVADVERFEAELGKLEFARMFSGKMDGAPAFVDIQAGAGGTEAQDWAMMLFRMHTRFAEKMGFKVKVMDYLDGDDAGMKSGVLLIEGTNAYGYLKSENGVHRLVRISPFDAAGKRHTSFASVEVMPEIDDESNKIEIREEDIEVDAHRSSGAGGQHVNKTDSAIRIVHKPTGIVVGCQSERSQKQNKETALRMLKSKLIEIKEREHLEKIDDIKGDQKKIEWGSQIRSYVFMPYTLVKDHRTGFEVGNVNAVMDGELDGFVDAYLKHIKE